MLFCKGHFKYAFEEAEYLCIWYLDDDQQVAQADDQQWTEEAHGARVYDKRRLPHLCWFGPHDAAVPIIFEHVCKNHHRQNHHKGARPHGGTDGLRHSGPPPPEGADGVHHS